MVERKITICIQDLNLPVYVKNALLRNGIKTLNELEKENSRGLSNIRGIGADGIRAINDILDNIDTVFESFEAKNEQINALSDELCKKEIDVLAFSTRAYNALRNAGISTIYDLVRMSSQDIFKLRNIGAQSRDEICKAIDYVLTYQDEALKEMALVKSSEGDADGLNAFMQANIQVDTLSLEQVKGFDFDVIDVLTGSFYLKPSCMTNWFDLSRQGVYDVLSKRSPKRKQKWTGYDLTEQEKQQLFYMIENKQLEYEDDNGVICHCFNNRCDNLAAVFVYTDEIKCYFLKDMPNELQDSLTCANMHRYTKRELEGDADGTIVYVIKKAYFNPTYPDKFRTCAQIRGLSADEYAHFIAGYPIADQRNVTDTQIIEFFEANCKDGKVYISSDPKNQWIRSLAARNGYSIKDFIELYGFESKMNGNELTVDGARERHIEELKKCVIKDNIVYFPTDSRIYRLLSSYVHSKDIQLNNYISSLGFVRTIERPQMTDDNQESDMKIYKSDGKYEERIFAYYPLLGSKIIPPDTLNKLHDNTKKYIDFVLKNPSSKLPLRAEMQITLSLINHAKKLEH